MDIPSIKPLVTNELTLSTLSHLLSTTQQVEIYCRLILYLHVFIGIIMTYLESTINY